MSNERKPEGCTCPWFRHPCDGEPFMHEPTPQCPHHAHLWRDWNESRP